MSFVDPPLAEVGDWPPPAPANAADLIAVASEQVRGYCGWQISYRPDDQITLDWDGRPLLGLPSLRVLDVASLEAAGAVLDPGAYQWYGSGLIRILWGVHGPPGPRVFTATVTHGYDPVPMAVSGVVLQVAQNLESNPYGANSVRVGDVSVTYGAGVANSGLAVITSAATALAPYKIGVVA